VRRVPVLIFLALVGSYMATSLAQSSPSSAATAARVVLPKRECPDVGPPQTDVGLYKITTRKIICGRARAILRRWYHDPTQKDSGPAGWRCAEVRRGRYEVRSYCHRNGRLIAFTRYAL
jgi:hypothetical protein